MQLLPIGATAIQTSKQVLSWEAKSEAETHNAGQLLEMLSIEKEGFGCYFYNLSVYETLLVLFHEKRCLHLKCVSEVSIWLLERNFPGLCLMWGFSIYSISYTLLTQQISYSQQQICEKSFVDHLQKKKNGKKERKEKRKARVPQEEGKYLPKKGEKGRRLPVKLSEECTCFYQ